jgi:hypothetical protein
MALSFSYFRLIRFILITDSKDKFTGKIVIVIIIFLLGICDRGEKSCSLPALRGPMLWQAGHAVNYQSPITNHQSPITNHQSPITNHQLPITNHQLPITNHQSLNPEYRLPVTMVNSMTKLFPFRSLILRLFLKFKVMPWVNPG